MRELTNNTTGLRILVTFSLCVLATSLDATPIRSPVSAVVNAGGEFDSDRDIGNTIDQSGLSVGFTSGVTDFDAYLATNPTHTVRAIGQEYFTVEGNTAAVITYDLGAVYTVDRLALWNEEFSGIGLLDVFSSTDNINFSQVAAGIVPFDNPLGPAYPAEIFALTTTDAQYIRFDISNSPQPNGSNRLLVGIGEVAFSAAAPAVNPIPEPSSFGLLGLGLAAIGVSHRRKMRKAKNSKCSR